MIMSPIETAPRWLMLHVPLFMMAYALLFAATLAGILFIIQDRMIKSHRPLPVLFRLPSLEAMERLLYGAIVAAYPLLCFGIILGACWQHAVQGRYWGWDPTETFSLVTWMVYSTFLIVRWASGWRGRQATYLALAGFGLVLLSLAALVFHSPLHQLGRGF